MKQRERLKEEILSTSDIKELGETCLSRLFTDFKDIFEKHVLLHSLPAVFLHVYSTVF